MYGRFKEFLSKTFLTALSSVFALVTFSPALYAQDEQISQSNNDVEELVVTGFRGSLEAALNNKREATNNIESIIAEDIGKMPDLNLAESLQRVPGVAINREGGEGRNITVRGLGPDFTRTTLNGMEVPASAGGIDSSGGVNRSRSLDFNIFASELFNRIDINKTQRASIEEGGLASTVELYTPKPFDNPGFHISGAAQGAMDNAADETDPRMAAIISSTFMDDTLGFLVSYASSERTVRQEGAGTVRWMAPQDNGNRSWANSPNPLIEVHGTPNPDANDADGEYVDGVSDPLDFLIMPRLPRSDFFGNDLEREGYTAAVQFRPSDRLEFTLDVVGSELKTNRTGYNFFAQFRDQFQNITPIELTLDPTGRYVVAGTFRGVIPRAESRSQNAVTDFTQTILSGSYDLSDSIALRFMAGKAESEHTEDQLRFNMDALNGGGVISPGTALVPRFNENLAGNLGASEVLNGVDPTLFRFDFRSSSNVPELFYGFDITDPDNYEIANADLRRDIVDRDNKTLKFDLEFKGDNSTIRTGIISNNREVDAQRQAPVLNDGTEIPNNLLSGQRVNSFPNAYTEPFPYSGNFAEAIDPPAGFITNWRVNDFAAAGEAYGLTGNFQLRAVDASAFFNIEEDILGAYGEYEMETELFSSPLRFNAGLRYVDTETVSKGAVLIGGIVTPITETRSADEVLPAFNALLDIQDDLLLRLGLSRNLSRPALASLAPNITGITPNTGTIALGNPDLEPTLADSLDVGLEWYFTDEALLALTLFFKEFESIITQQTLQGPLDAQTQELVAAARPDTADGTIGSTQVTDIWNINQAINGEEAELDGYEIAYQQPFSGLPGFLSNFGIILNYTHVDSEVTYGLDAFGREIVAPLEGQSESSHNFTLYYETEVWGARASFNERDDYITNARGADRNLQEATTGPTRLDGSAFFNVTDEITITLEAINLTEEDERLYTTGPLGDLNLVREFNNTGREVYLGARFSY
jgi:iron complex outermembrane receptor protein